MWPTAFFTPFPWYSFLTSSRSSRASWMPVDAPDGTAARKSPFSVVKSTSTVGLPRESKIIRAKIFWIDMMALVFQIWTAWNIKDKSYFTFNSNKNCCQVHWSTVHVDYSRSFNDVTALPKGKGQYRYFRFLTFTVIQKYDNRNTFIQNISTAICFEVNKEKISRTKVKRQGCGVKWQILQKNGKHSFKRFHKSV